MGRRSLHGRSVRDEAIAFQEHIQAKALARTEHMFLKQKRYGKIKGRTVAGGNKQRDYISKEDDSLLTVATESVLLSCIIDAEEEWDVRVVDIPNGFVQT
jgi:hypothetical protein